MTVKANPDFALEIPPGDDKQRRVCQRCDFIDYQNPRIVAGAVVLKDDKILLCKRAIEPRKGCWTLPAGFMELGESVEEAAKREAQEEALATIEIDRLLAVYSVPRIGQVHVMFRAHLHGDFGVGPESEEVKLVRLEGHSVVGLSLSHGGLGAQSLCRNAAPECLCSIRQPARHGRAHALGSASACSRCFSIRGVFAIMKAIVMNQVPSFHHVAQMVFGIAAAKFDSEDFIRPCRRPLYAEDGQRRFQTWGKIAPDEFIGERHDNEVSGPAQGEHVPDPVRQAEHLLEHDLPDVAAKREAAKDN